MLSQSYQSLNFSKLIYRVFLTSAIAIVSITVAELNSQAVDAQDQAYPRIPSVNALQARPGDADLLRPAPGLPVTPTISSPLTDSTSNDSATPSSETELESIDFSAEPITPVTPSIPNASPNSPSRNLPVKFTTDPVYAVPLFRD